MSDYRPDLSDVTHLLLQVLDAPTQLKDLPGPSHSDAELWQQVLDEAGKFVGQVVAPLNRDGDEIGCRWQDGQVTTPPGFREAYQAFWQAGWPALGCAEEDGGQGLPWVLEGVLYEWLSAANHGWTMAPGGYRDTAENGVMASAEPSAGAFFKDSRAMRPPAPGLFSTTALFLA